MTDYQCHALGWNRSKAFGHLDEIVHPQPGSRVPVLLHIMKGASEEASSILHNVSGSVDDDRFRCRKEREEEPGLNV